jgi:hypothetical protein
MTINKNLPVNYGQTLLEIKDRINHARYQSLKAVNKELILVYLEIGKIISERVKSGWGDAVVDKLSVDLQVEYPGVKGFSPRNLRRMKQIYDETADSLIWTQLVTKLPWGHTNVIFSKIKVAEQITFILLEHSKKVFAELPQAGRLSKQKNREERFINQLPHEFSQKDYVEVARHLNIPDKTAQNYIAKLLKMGFIHTVISIPTFLTV